MVKGPKSFTKVNTAFSAINCVLAKVSSVMKICFYPHQSTQLDNRFPWLMLSKTCISIVSYGANGGN